MACNNRKIFEAELAKSGLQNVQLVVNPINNKNIKNVIYKGVEYKTAQWYREHIQMFITNATKECVNKGQKLNIPYYKPTIEGLLTDVSEVHLDNLYKKRLPIIFETMSLKECLINMVSNRESGLSITGKNYNEYETWIMDVIKWHAIPDDSEKAHVSINDLTKEGLENAYSYIAYVLTTDNMDDRIYNIRGYIYSNSELFNFIETWHLKNNLKVSKEDVQKKIDLFIECFN